MMCIRSTLSMLSCGNVRAKSGRTQGKPCIHALCLITTPEFRDVRMEDFVDEYYSLAMFTTTYSRVVQPIGDKSFWPDVPFAKEVGAPIGKHVVGRQRKNRIKGCLEGGSGKK
jgi:hypothetical protein